MRDASPALEADPVVGDEMEAILVFVHASGFTKLTEAMAKKPHGAEELGTFLNELFGKLIDIIRKWGGDIIKFSGDAVTIIFPMEEEDPVAPLHAACCCEEIHDEFLNYETPVKTSISFHIGVGFGEVKLLQLGGVRNRMEYCVCGSPISEISVAEPLAEPGETCFSPRFVNKFKHHRFRVVH